MQFVVAISFESDSFVSFVDLLIEEDLAADETTTFLDRLECGSLISTLTLSVFAPLLVTLPVAGLELILEDCLCCCDDELLIVVRLPLLVLEVVVVALLADALVEVLSLELILKRVCNQAENINKQQYRSVTSQVFIDLYRSELQLVPILPLDFNNQIYQ